MEQRNSASSTGRRKSLKNVAGDYCLAAKARRAIINLSSCTMKRKIYREDFGLEHNIDQNWRLVSGKSSAQNLAATFAQDVGCVLRLRTAD